MSSSFPMSFKKRIHLAFSTIIALFFVVTGLVLYQFNQINVDIERMDKSILPYAITSQEMAFDVVQVQQFLTDVSASHDPAGYSEAEKAAKRFSKGISLFEERYRNNNAKLEQIRNLNVAFNVFYQQGKKMATIYVDKGIVEGNVFMESFDLKAEQITQLVHQLKEENVKNTRVISNKISQRTQSAIAWTLGLFMAAVIIAIILTIKIANRLYSQLGIDPFFVQGIAKEMSKGNLQRNIQLDEGDNFSLLYAIKNMQTKLKEIIGQMNKISNAINCSTGHLNEVFTEVTSSSETQNQYALNTAMGMEEMTTSINKISQNANSSAEQAGTSGHLADEGYTIVNAAAAEMEEIAHVVSESSEIIGKLSDSSKHISDVVEVINQIANQTNLLALNAAIEAARAGEQGRGFAVVADEVRGLAERTSQSTQEVAAIIEQIQTNASDAVLSMEIGHKNVNEGVVKARHAGKSMTEIKNSASLVRDSIADISIALEQQNLRITEITGEVSNISKLSDKNTHSIHDLTESIKDLDKMAESLSNAISFFKL